MKIFARLFAALCLSAFAAAQVVPNEGPQVTNACIESAQAVVSGVMAASNGLPASNYSLVFNSSQTGFISGCGAQIPMATACATSTDGSVVGLGNPLVATQVSRATGTLPAANYYVEYSFYDDNNDETLVSPETVFQISGGAAGLTVAIPASGLPSGAVGMRIYIGTASGTETLQGSTTGVQSYVQSVPLIAGTNPLASNNTVCAIVANDAIWPSGTGYNVTLADTKGNTLPGYPMMWQITGPGTTINVGSGLPYYHGTVTYPTPIVANPPNHATQTVSGTLSLGGYGVTAGGTSSFNNIQINGTCTGPGCGSGGAGGGGGFTAGLDLAGTSTAQTVIGIEGHQLASLPSYGYPYFSGGVWTWQDLSAPPAIGNATPNAGTFTAVTAGSETLNGSLTLPITGSTQCLHVNTSGVVSGTGMDCGSGGGGGGFTAGGDLSGTSTSQTVIGIEGKALAALPSKGYPYYTGTAWSWQDLSAPPAIGSSVPSTAAFSTLSAGNTTFTGSVTLPLTGATNCLQANSSGVVGVAGGPCGTFPGASWTYADPTLTGGATARLNLSGAPAATGFQMPVASGALPTVAGGLAFDSASKHPIDYDGTANHSMLHKDDVGIAPTTNGLLFQTVHSGMAPTLGTAVIQGTAGDIAVSNGDAQGGNPVISSANTGVTAGTYSCVTLTVNAAGKVTSASTGNCTGGGGNTTSTNLISGNLPVANGANSIIDSGISASSISSLLTNPMTTLGDTLYENSTPAPARLPGYTAANMAVLTQMGTGSASAAPAWSNAPALSAANMTTFPSSVCTTSTCTANTTGTSANITGSSNGTLTALTGGALTLGTNGGNLGSLQLNGSISGNFTVTPSSSASTVTLAGSGFNTLIVPTGTVNQPSVGSTSSTGIYFANSHLNFTQGGTLAFVAGGNGVNCNGTCVWSGSAFNQPQTFQSGIDAATPGAISGTAVFKSGAVTSGTTTASGTGLALVQSGDNAATGGAAQSIGNLVLTSGGYVGASGATTAWVPGYTIMGQKYWADTTTTAGTLACITTPGTNGQMPKVGTCTATSNVPWIGVITSTTGQSVFVTKEGHVSGVVSNASSTDTAGYFVCVDNVHAGDVIVQSTPCSAGTTVGFIDQTGSAGTAHNVNVVPPVVMVAGGGGGVTSFTGDSNGLISNSGSTGAVTVTLNTAGAHKWFGNNTGSTAAPGYEAIGAADLPAALSSSTSVNGTTIPASSTLPTTGTLVNGNVVEATGASTLADTGVAVTALCTTSACSANTTGTAANITGSSNSTLTALTSGTLALGSNGGGNGVLQLNGSTSGNFTITPSATSNTATLGGSGYTTLLVPNGSATAVAIGSAANTGLYNLNSGLSWASNGNVKFIAQAGNVICYTNCSFEGDAFNRNDTFQSGQDTTTLGSGTPGGTATFRSGTITGGTTTGSSTGNVTVQSGDNGATGGTLQTIGNVVITAGGFTGASGASTAWTGGYTEIHQRYWADATTTVGTLACYTTPGTNGQMPKVGTCTVTSNVPWIGIIVTTVGQAVEVAKIGHAANVVSAASATDTAGYFVCVDTSNAGKVLVQTTSCPTGQGVGIIDVTGSGGTSHSVDVERN